MTKHVDSNTDTTSNSTEEHARFAAGDSMTTAQGDPDVSTSAVMTGPPENSATGGEATPLVAEDAMNGPPEGSSHPLERDTGEPSSLHFSEVLPSEELPVDAPPHPGEPGSVTDGSAGRIEQDTELSTLDLTQENEALRRRSANQQKEIEGLRKMLQVAADVIQAIPAGLFLFQYQPPGELFFLNCNSEATRLTGLGQEDCRGVEIDEIWPNARNQGLIDAFLAAARSGKSFDADKVLYRNSKIERILRVKAFAIPGERLGVAFLELAGQPQPQSSPRGSQEQTDARMEETASLLAGRNQQLEAECAALKQSRETALKSSRVEAHQEAALGVARMVSSPIENVREAAQRALARLDSGYMSLMRPSLEQIQQEADRLSNVVKYLKQCAGMAPAGALSQHKPLDLSGLVRERMDAVSSDDNPDSGHHAKSAFQEPLLGPDCCVRCDPAEMRDVVDTLLNHALTGLDAPGCITVKTFCTADSVVLEVSDAGREMPQEEIETLFEPFCLSKPGQLGPGLAGVSGVIRRCGGDVGVVTESGKGTIISVRLPRVESM